MTVPISILEKFKLLNYDKVLNNIDNPKGKNKIILDTDTANEIDDQFALAWTLLSEDKIDLIGVTAEPYSFQHHREELIQAYKIINDNEINNTNIELVNSYSSWVKGLVDSEIDPKNIYFDTPSEGQEKSYNEINKIFNLMDINTNNRVFRGSTEYLEDFDQPYMNESTDFIIQSCLNNLDEKIYVCAIGCLTNIASALLIEPKIIKNLVVVWTSGFPSYSPLNNKPSLNLVQDVKASQLVFSCGVSVVYLPGFNVGAQLTISLPEMNEFVKGRGKIGDYLYYLYTNNPLHKQRGVKDQLMKTWIIWDIINIAWMIEPSWVSTIVLDMPDLDDKLFWTQKKRKQPMREAVGINRDSIFRDFYIKLDNLK